MEKELVYIERLFFIFAFAFVLFSTVYCIDLANKSKPKMHVSKGVEYIFIHGQVICPEKDSLIIASEKVILEREKRFLNRIK